MTSATIRDLPLSERLTVIIPTYARSEMLGRAIDSVMTQSVVPRVLVVDDGSDPPAVLHRTDPLFALYRLETNMGGAAARNIGAEQVKTPWITFLDDDDEWLSGTGALYDALLPGDPRPDLSHVSGIEVVGPRGNRLQQRRAVSRRKGEAWFLEHTPRGYSHLTKQTFVIPTALFRRIGGFDAKLESRIHSEFALRLNRAANVEAIDQATYRLHKHGAAQVSKDPGKRHRSFMYIWRRHEATMKLHPAGSARWAQDHARRLFEEGSWRDALHALWLAIRSSPRSALQSARIVLDAARS